MTSLTTLPDDLFAELSHWIPENGAIKLLRVGNRALTQSLQRNLRCLQLASKCSGFLDTTLVIEAATRFNRLEELHFTSSYLAHRIVLPLNLDILPSSLVSLTMSFRGSLDFLTNSERSSFATMLPQLVSLRLESLYPMDGSISQRPLKNLPASLTSLALVSRQQYYVVDADIPNLPHGLKSLELRGVPIDSPMNNISGFISVLSSLQRLVLDDELVKTDNSPSTRLNLAQLPPSLTWIEVFGLQLDVDCVVPYSQKGNSAASTSNSNGAQVNDSKYVDGMVAWKKMFPNLKALITDSFTAPFAAIQQFPSSMRNIGLNILPPEAAEAKKDSSKASSSSSAVSIPDWLSSCDFVSSLTVLEDSSSWKLPLVSRFKNLVVVSLDGLNISVPESGATYRLPPSIIDLTCSVVIEIDALPTGLTRLNCSELILPTGTPADHSGLPAALRDLRVYPGRLNFNHAFWLPPSLTSLQGLFENQFWQYLRPSLAKADESILMPKTHPHRQYPPTDAEKAIPFLPHLSIIYDLHEASELVSFSSVPESVEELYLNVGDNGRIDRSDLWVGLRDLRNLRSLQLTGSSFGLTTLFPHLPSGLEELKLNCRDRSLTYKDIRTLPPNLKVLRMVNNLAEFNFDDGNDHEFVKEKVAKALPRKLHTLVWRMAIKQGHRKLPVKDFVSALPPDLDELDFAYATLEMAYFDWQRAARSKAEMKKLKKKK